MSQLLGYFLAFCCGFMACVNIWQLVSWRREVREYREQAARDAAWDQAHGVRS